MKFPAVWIWLLAASGLVLLGWPAPASAKDGEQLIARHAELEGRLRQNVFGRQLVLESLETADRMQGEIHAVVNHPFSAVSAGLNSAASWCDVISLHINTKYCRAVATPSGTKLNVNIGKKTAEDLKNAARVEFNYTTVAATPRYLNIQLNAQSGPLGTRDYRIEFEAAPLGAAQTFVRLGYSYSVNASARLAMNLYLATLGRGKLGFTQVPNAGGGPPDYVTGLRALIERNTMRYYLAIDSFLEAASATPSAQLDQRLQSWFTAVERYPRQLHEMNRSEYVAMKRDEYLRQQTAD